MKTKELGIEFCDLSELAKRRAIEHTRMLMAGDWMEAEEVTRQLRDCLKYDYNMPEMRVSWELGHCQGDGVWFYGGIDIFHAMEKDSWLRDFIEREQGMWSLAFYPGIVPLPFVSIGKSEFYRDKMHVECHSAYIEDVALESWQEDVCNQLEKHFDERSKEIRSELKRTGYSIIESMTSEEAAIDMILANNYKFNRDGNGIRA